jgi:hypothetical protein
MHRIILARHTAAAQLSLFRNLHFLKVQQSIIMPPMRFVTLSNGSRIGSSMFTAPLVKERELKRSTFTSSQDIFKEVNLNHTTMDFKQASSYLADLSNVIIPAD